MLILFLQLGKAKSPNNKKELGGFSMTLQDSCFIKRTFPFIKQSKTERTRYPFHVTLLCTENREEVLCLHLPLFFSAAALFLRLATRGSYSQRPSFRESRNESR